MTPLTEAVRAKIMGLKVDNQAYLELFEAIAADANIRGVPSATLVVTIYGEDDLSPGDWAPELHFVVRQVAEPEPEPEPEQESND